MRRNIGESEEASLNLLHFHFEMRTHYVTTFASMAPWLHHGAMNFTRVVVCIYIYHVSFQEGKTKGKKRKWTFLNIISLFSVEKNASSKATRKWQSLPRVSLVSHFYKVSILVTRIRHLFLFLKIFFIDSTHGLLELEV